MKNIQDAESEEELDQADRNAYPKTNVNEEYKIVEDKKDKESSTNNQINNNANENANNDSDSINQMQKSSQIQNDTSNRNRKNTHKYKNIFVLEFKELILLKIKLFNHLKY